MRPRRPALRYHGGKWQMARWIISHFPEHVCYVEPFGGAGSVLLRKVPSFIEVYNDIDNVVVNFFKVLRERPAELIAAIELTPYSREEFLQAQEPTTDPLESARRFYVWAWQGRGRAGVKEPGGWRLMRRANRSKTPVDDWNETGHLWAVAARMKQVHIERDDALTVIARYDGPATLFYVDPPYVQRTRSDRWGKHAYRYEFSDAQHRELARVLHGCAGMVVLSGYSCALYDELYSDWECRSRVANTDNGGRAVECLWLSPGVNGGQLELEF